MITRLADALPLLQSTEPIPLPNAEDIRGQASAIVKRLDSRSAARLTLDSTAWAASAIPRAASTIASPAEVGLRPRPVRSKSGTPNCDSSSVIWRDSVGW
jgi:hypothetical protein